MMLAFNPRERMFMEYLQDGITAAKAGQHQLAQSLLNRAIHLNGMDARPYIWLSATTTDPKEQMEYLERAVALDPNNSAARRGLAVLKGKIDPARLVTDDGRPAPTRTASEELAAGAAFLCPNCGGRMSSSVLSGALTCEFCGYSEQIQDSTQGEPGPLYSIAAQAEQVLDFVMPTTLGHDWAQAQQKLTCERCGAHSLLPPGQKTIACPYCGSNQIIKTAAGEELIEPQCIALMTIDEPQALRLGQRWLSKGFLAPDNLNSSSRTLRLRPGYYSFWTFDGMVEVRWSCEVAEGNGQYKQWTPMTGSESRFFNDVLTPGIKAFSLTEIEALKPFDLENVATFSVDYLAGWPTVLYDRSLAEASLLGRESLLKDLRPEFYSVIAMGYEKRNLSLGGIQWSGMTFKHILLPIWVGEYLFQGKTYRLLVNGQTGKVTGEKPRDSMKMILILLSVGLVILLVILIFWILSSL